MEEAGLMTNLQYRQSEQILINWMQSIHEQDNGNVGIVLPQPKGEDSDDDNFDDPSIKTHSTERKKALEEYQSFCNTCKKQQNWPQTYV
jgi:hypothetical protein